MANGWRDWARSISQNIVAALLWSLIPGAVLTYLAHIGSEWANPALIGLAAAFFATGICVVLMAASHLPRKRVEPDSSNIETCIRTWLDNYKIAVKTDPIPGAYFRFRITLDSGMHMTVIRSKTEYVDYVQVLCDMGLRGEQESLFELFSSEERADLILDIKLELARAGVSFGGLSDPPKDFHLFRRIPIHHNLSEYIFMSAVGEVEAASLLVAVVFQKAKQKVDTTQTARKTADAVRKRNQ